MTARYIAVVHEVRLPSHPEIVQVPTDPVPLTTARNSPPPPEISVQPGGVVTTLPVTAKKVSVMGLPEGVTWTTGQVLILIPVSPLESGERSQLSLQVGYIIQGHKHDLVGEDIFVGRSSLYRSQELRNGLPSLETFEPMTGEWSKRSRRFARASRSLSGRGASRTPSSCGTARHRQGLFAQNVRDNLRKSRGHMDG